MEYIVILHLADGSTVRTCYSVSLMDRAFAHAREYALAGKRFTLTVE